MKMPNISVNKLFTSLYLVAVFVTTLIIIVCAWVGAEYLIEGAVVVSRVDGFFAVAGAYYLTRDFYAYQCRAAKKNKR